jgi:hypothetical protein
MTSPSQLGTQPKTKIQIYSGHGEIIGGDVTYLVDLISSIDSARFDVSVCTDESPIFRGRVSGSHGSVDQRQGRLLRHAVRGLQGRRRRGRAAIRGALATFVPPQRRFAGDHRRREDDAGAEGHGGLGGQGRGDPDNRVHDRSRRCAAGRVPAIRGDKHDRGERESQRGSVQEVICPGEMARASG